MGEEWFAEMQIQNFLDALFYFYDLLKDTLIITKDAGDKSGRIFSCSFYSTTFGKEISFLYDARHKYITNEEVRRVAAKELVMEYYKNTKR